MPPRPDDPRDTQPDLTPEQDEQVRRLLAEARHDEPVPAEVAARLDRVLAGLAEEPSREGAVTRLADRRRRAATMLVAAAAVVVGGVGVAQVLPTSSNEQTGATSAESDSAPASEAEAGGSADSPESSLAQGGDALAGKAVTRSRQSVKRVAADRFARDAARLRSHVVVSSSAVVDGEEFTTGRGLAEARGRAVCDPGAWGAGDYAAVLYDGAEGWVVFREPQGETQVADLFLCGSDVATRSVTLPMR